MDERPRNRGNRGGPRDRRGGERESGRGRGNDRGRGRESGRDRGRESGRESERDRGREGERGRDRGRPAAALRPLLEKQRLDLDRPADQPLSAEEARVMSQHLAFLRRFKGVLRLSLNAQEDLLINGVKPPVDRGACRHLLSKIDRATIDRVLTRETMDAPQRAAFLAGIVRIDPDPDLLLRYLEAVAETSDRRDAARAFALTIDRLDFSKISLKQTQQILSVIARTFREHDRVQALFGLLENDSFRASLGKVLVNLEGELAEMFGPLAAAHRVVFEGEAPPDEDEDRRDWIRGVELLLAAPDAVLRGYPEAARARVAELALRGGLDDKASRDALRSVIASLPAKEYVALRRARVEQLLAAHEVDEARSLLGVLLAAPEESGVAAWAKQRRTALDGKRVGPLIAGAVHAHDSPFRVSLWLDRASFVLAKIGPATEAGKLTAEARLQEQLTLPSVAPVLTHGLSEDGTVYLAIPQIGPVFRGPNEGASLNDRLWLCWQGASLLSALADRGVVMPDLRATRFLLRDVLVLSDLAGATHDEPARAGLAYGSLAVTWCRAMLESVDRSTIPPGLRSRLRGATSLRLLLRELAALIGLR